MIKNYVYVPNIFLTTLKKNKRQLIYPLKKGREKIVWEINLLWSHAKPYYVIIEP